MTLPSREHFINNGIRHPDGTRREGGALDQKRRLSPDRSFVQAAGCEGKSLFIPSQKGNAVRSVSSDTIETEEESHVADIWHMRDSVSGAE
jgi:hypothetical protein